MQLQFTMRPTYGTSLQATYTWAKSMETPGTGWTNPLDRDADYRLASNHRAHEFRMNGTVQLPLGPNQLLFGNSSGTLARLIENWKLSWTYNVFSGAPGTISAQNMLYGNGTPDVVGPWNVKKGDVLGIARIAGIQAAKKTSDLIPLCHPLALTRVAVEFELEQAQGASPAAVACTATVETVGPTGVEMEALTAVNVALLTIYDMCKAVDRGMTITGVHLVEKHGGKSGRYVAP